MIQGIESRSGVDEMIVRQTCLQFAIGLYTDKSGTTNATAEQILVAAEKFSTYVLGPKTGNGNVTALKAIT